jgi:hypothetical protein
VILYRKGGPARVRRYAAPEPPFWCATTLAPYSARRATPVAIDYTMLRASAADRLEVTVCASVRDDLERSRAIEEPVLIEATEAAEPIFRRGEEALAFCEEQRLGALHMISTRGTLPVQAPAEMVLVLAAWPLDLAPIAEVAEEARRRSLTWGVAVPLIYPVSTDLTTLETLADISRDGGAAFLTAIHLQVEATAKQVIAQSMSLDGEDDRYAMLFHGDVGPIHLATERHIAALAAERGMADFIVPPRWDERSNWNAAVLLTLIASRMIALELDLDLAGRILRSARVVAALDKPLTRVAEAANLAIIEALDETSVEVLTEWIRGESPSFVAEVNEQWRLSRNVQR